MTHSIRTCICVLASMLLLPYLSSASQAVFRPIAYMNYYDQPGGLLEGSPGVFYFEGGASTSFSVLSITTQGTETVLTSVPPNYILTGLASGSNGRFYSTFGTSTNPTYVFSITSAPGSRKIYAGQPFDPIMTENLPDSHFLAVGTTNTQPLWSLEDVSLDGKVTSLYTFSATDRLDNAIFASDGNYYGVAQQNPAGTGYVFRVTPSGSMTPIYNFAANSFPGIFGVALLQADDGLLYGTTPNGGANGTGTIYSLALDGQYTLLYSFPAGKLGGPTSLTEGGDGNLYGSTLGAITNGGYSQLFRISKQGHFELLHNMSNLVTDGACGCSLIQGSDGKFYGTAVGGGKYNGGLVFSLNVGLPPPPPHAQHFSPGTGAVGTQVLLWGTNLLSATVSFNGVPATNVSSSGANYVWATVPAGATSGPITVTTPGGSVTTHANFTVQ